MKPRRHTGHTGDTGRAGHTDRTSHTGRAVQAGQSAVEYLIVAALFALAISVGPNSALEQLFEAIGERYQRFTLAVSMP